MNVTLLANPAARSGALGRAASEAAERLRELGATAILVSGGSAAESSELLREIVRSGTDAVVVVGGDGTVALALQHVGGTDIPLGIVPAGTGNDFASALGLRELDVRGAADVIAAAHTRSIDLASVTRSDGTIRFFGSVLASGFDSLVNDRANAMRWPRGGSRYTIAILAEFLALKGIPYRVDWTNADGTTETLDGDLVMATVGNTRTYGGGIPICPAADAADGVLDLTLVRPAGRARLLRLLPSVYRGTHATAAEVQTRRVRSVRLEAAGVMAYADGDPIGVLPLTVDVAPAAVRMLVPA